jgi:hypothetical protein
MATNGKKPRPKTVYSGKEIEEGSFWVPSGGCLLWEMASKRDQKISFLDLSTGINSFGVGFFAIGRQRKKPYQW